MSSAACRQRANEILKGKYAEGFFVVSVCIVVYLIFKVFDIAGAGVILYNNNVNVYQLFCSDNIAEIVIKVLRYILCFIIMSPLITGGLWWFYQTAAGEDNRSILKLYTGFRLNMRAARLYGLMWIISMLSLLPSGICWMLAYRLFCAISDFNSQGIVLFAVLQLFMAGIVLLSLYIKSMLTMILSPFIFIKHPDMSAFKVLKISGKKMYGAKLELLKMIIAYIPAMLPAVTIPFVLPKAVMAVSVFAGERLREEQVGKDSTGS